MSVLEASKNKQTLIMSIIEEKINEEGNKTNFNRKVCLEIYLTFDPEY